MRNIYCCVDVEASGPVPGLYDLVSIGAVAVVATARDAHEVVESPTFYAELRPQGGRIDPEAMAVHGLSTAHLAAHGSPVAAALENLTAWALDRRSASDDRLVFVGHNAPFDWAHVNHAYHAAHLENPFGWKALDTKALAMGVLGLDWFDTNKENLARLLPELGDQDEARVHRADYDALYQAHVLRCLLDHPRRRDHR